jgi:speckle-type POZ protein
VTGTVTASHNFEVTNFPMLDGMGIGKFVSSSTFTVGGCDWRIDFYPDGNDAANQGAYVSVFLYFVRGTGGASVTLSFSLLLGNSSEQVTETSARRTFESAGGDWGFNKLIEKSSLRESLRRLNNHGCFTVRCVLTVREAPRTEDVDAGAVVVPQPKLRRDLAEMLKSGEGADVTFSVGDQRLFPAHRCILAARSMVFRAELFGAMKEKDAQRIVIDDMEPAVLIRGTPALRLHRFLAG